MRTLLRAARARRAAPPVTHEARFRIAPDDQYRQWLRHHAPGPAELDAMCRQSAGFAVRPTISIAVPVFDTPLELLRRMAESVLGQVYERWQLCLADDGSSAAHIPDELNRLCESDRRVVATRRPHNGGIAAATNSALELADGEWIAFLDHDDVLQPHALYRMVEAVNSHPGADVVYSDEDKTLLDGQRGQVHFKHDFDPDLLLAGNYVSHLSMYRRELLRDIGGVRHGFDGSQDHDLALRATERARGVVHVADVLYSWTQIPGSAALGAHEKPHAWEAEVRAVADALQRRSADASAVMGPFPGLITVRHSVPAETSVSVILHGDGGDALPLHNAGCDVQEVIRASETGSRPTAAALNDAAQQVQSDVVVFIGAGLRPVRDGWLQPLVAQALRADIGAAGGRVVSADGAPEHEGYHLGGDAVAESIGVLWPVAQRVAAVSSDALAIRRGLFHEHGGFDTRYRRTLHDVDLCLRLRAAGHAVIYTPQSELRREHRTTAGWDDADRAVFNATWPAPGDPYVSPWVERLEPFVIRADSSPDV